MKCKLCNQPANLSYPIKQFKYYYCENCITLFMSPQPSEKYLSNYYFKNFTYSAGEANENLIRMRSRKILHTLLTLKSNIQTLLDIGSGFGYFVEEATDIYINTYGIEPSKILYDKNPLSIKNRILNTDFESYSREFKNKFDCVTLIHLIEHVKYPQSMIKKALKLLNPGGILYIETPNLDSHLYWVEKENYTFLTPPEHMWVYSKRSFSHIIPNDYRVKIQTYSYPEHLMGILKCKFKKRLKQQPKSMMNPKQEYSTAITNMTLKQKVSYLILDKTIAPFLTPLLNLNHKGSILELYVKK